MTLLVDATKVTSAISIMLESKQVQPLTLFN